MGNSLLETTSDAEWPAAPWELSVSGSFVMKARRTGLSSFSPLATVDVASSGHQEVKVDPFLFFTMLWAVLCPRACRSGRAEEEECQSRGSCWQIVPRSPCWEHLGCGTLLSHLRNW